MTHPGIIPIITARTAKQYNRPCIIIAVVTSGLSLFGLLAGNRLGERFGKRMEVLGGLLLIGIGLRVLMTHIFV